ncbi:MAG: SGNH/GDSL hydrolase family protein [Lentisphaeria bacterium]|nr:SGNH/GDSL hydrolase family protein [Lentisphaeria bacterium]
MLEMQQNWIDRSVIAVGSLEPLERLRAKIKNGQPIVYGSIGGSITEGAKADSVEGRYPNLIAAHIGAKLVNAGIGASGSLFGCYRAKNDLLKYNPDFITIEYAVNDANKPEIQPGFEGLVRQCLALPTKPFVLLIFTMEENGTNVQHLHIPIGNHYQLPMISYRDALYPEVTAGRLTWRDLSPDEVHPNQDGHRLVAELVCHFLDTAAPTLHEQPLPEPLFTDSLRYATGRIVDATTLTVLQNDGWTTGPHRGGYTAFQANQPGAFLKVAFNGSIVTLGFKKYAGAFGMAEVQLDDQPPVIIDSYFPVPNDLAWKGGHTVLQELGRNLPAGQHTLSLRVLPEKHPQSTGHQFDFGYLLLAD